MKPTWLFTMILLVSFFIATTPACDKPAPDPEPTESNLVTKTVTFDTNDWSKWVYFSFESGSEVQIDDFLTSAEWDIAFHSIDIRLNCGTSGLVGQGGSYNAGMVDFTSITEAPTSGYSLNDSIDIIEDFIFPPTFVTVPGDTVLATWLNFSGPPPSYNLNDNIYIIKTADGKYAKIWLKDFFNDAAEEGYLKMQYAYQPDGSRNLK